MARTTGPLMSLTASGSVAKTITFAHWKGRPYVRQLVTPANPKSAGQYYNRAMMTFLSQQWKNLTTLQQASWDTIAKQMNVSAFNAFTSINRKRWTQTQPPGKSNPVGGTGTQDVFSSFVATGGVRQINFSINDTTHNNGWGIAIALSAPSGGSPAVALTRLITRADSVSTITGLLTGLVPGTYALATYLFTDDGAGPASGPTAVGVIVT